MILEIRTYRLHPGQGERFVGLMRSTVPMLRAAGITVVDCGPSLAREDGAEEAFLMRAFASLEERDALEGAFYGSEAWRTGPRADVLACIASYHTIVIEAAPAAVAALTR